MHTTFFIDEARKNLEALTLFKISLLASRKRGEDCGDLISVLRERINSIRLLLSYI